MPQCCRSAATALLTHQGFSEIPISLLSDLPIVCVTSAVSTDNVEHLREPPQHRPSPQVTKNPINSLPGEAFAIGTEGSREKQLAILMAQEQPQAESGGCF